LLFLNVLRRFIFGSKNGRQYRSHPVVSFSSVYQTKCHAFSTSTQTELSSEKTLPEVLHSFIRPDERLAEKNL
jgi:hypothetical protein